VGVFSVFFDFFISFPPFLTSPSHPLFVWIYAKKLNDHDEKNRKERTMDDDLQERQLEIPKKEGWLKKQGERFKGFRRMFLCLFPLSLSLPLSLSHPNMLANS
jgi:hypothetical protein